MYLNLVSFTNTNLINNIEELRLLNLSQMISLDVLRCMKPLLFNIINIQNTEINEFTGSIVPSR